LLHPLPGHVRDGAVDDGAGRDLENAVFARAAGFFPTRAAATFFGLLVGPVEKVPQTVGVSVDHEDDIAAAAAVPAVGSALRLELFAPETGAAVTAVAGLGKNFDVIDKHGELGGKSGRGETGKENRRHS